ncbi:MAG: cytochrome B [Rhodobacteraceae bacterium]|jgi:cytochrome b|uniref:Cytochrome b n=1 Tax=Salipiger profundus TaxID=1229727 RepID=A0A1U7D931_9RHOB|nr:MULTISPECIES: cytochrome b/b6 domain-containing protein [Salipiger]APX24570.1 cytochrome b [Salipiger profundus]MAB06539.1 cytochrome B [Paracoccaceae bacterium]GFZ96205.1 cytochrome b561 [Salipiger profundus]SFB82738.1 Cytochrome b [Salipiger profundus]
MTHHRIWDPLLRVFHWSLATFFVANAFFTDPEADLHHYVGYIIGGLIAFRLLWGFVGPHSARFASFLPNRDRVRTQLSDMATGRRRVHLMHTPLGALMIYNLLLTLAAIVATGYMMTTNAFWGVGWVEETHELLVDWAEISVLMHIAAVLHESRRTGVNLPGAMITGVKHVPDGANIES